MTTQLGLVLCHSDGRKTSLDIAIDQVILVGYSGRDRTAVQVHIRELELLGVPPPPRVPALYSVSPALVTTSSQLLVEGAQTSGEAEFVLLPGPHGVLVAVGSDHTDRQHETIDVAESKALCGKVISSEVWLLDDLSAHWDSLELRAWTAHHLYQEAPLGTLLTPSQLLAEVESVAMDSAQTAIFSGTLPTIGGFVFDSHFEVELRDPILNRQLRCAYDVAVAPARFTMPHR